MTAISSFHESSRVAAGIVQACLAAVDDPRMRNTVKEVRVSTRTELSGRLTERYLIEAGGYLVVRGALCAEVRVDAGGQLLLIGDVEGRVLNLGGTVVLVGRGCERIETFGGWTRVLDAEGDLASPGASASGSPSGPSTKR